MPSALTTIEEGAFEGLTSLSVVDARSCTSIGADAFKGTGLTQIRLSKDCQISGTAFNGDALIYVYAPAGGLTEACCDNHGNLIFVEQ